MFIKNLQTYGESPEWWAEDVYTAAQWLNKYVKMDKFWIPFPFRNSEHEKVNENAGKDFLAYCRSFAVLLENWEQIYSEAGDISGEILAEAKLK
jgi:hypothetical protein